MTGTGKWRRQGNRESEDEQLHIVTADGGPADVEHVLIGAAIARGGMSIEDAHAISVKLVRPATFLWKREGAS